MIEGIRSRIIDEYEQIRSRAAAEKDKRVKEVFERYPELLNIYNEINRLGIENTRNILENPHDAKKINEAFRKKLMSLTLKRDEFIKKNGIDPDFDKVKYQCSVCMDTGFIENGEKCSCFKDKIIHEIYKSSNLSLVMSDMCFENFSLDYYSDNRENGVSEREIIESILKESKKLIEGFDNYNRNMLFCGEPGLGKTFLSVAIAREVIKKGKSVIYISATKLFSNYEKYKFGKEDNLDDFLEDIYNADLLIIDDLGTEYISKVSVSFLFELVNERILKGKKMIINTNLTYNELKESYSARFMSRIYEYFNAFVLRGKDIRIQKQYK